MISIAFLGSPGAGKSSMIDMVTKGRAKPRPKISGRTDATDWSKNEDVDLFVEYQQLMIVDTPGYGTLAHAVNSYLAYFPFDVMDKIVLVIKGKIHRSDELIYWKIMGDFGGSASNRLMLVRGFADELLSNERAKVAEDFCQFFKLEQTSVPMMFCSNRTQEGLSDIGRFIGIERN